ncbi:hypothetical protein F511_13882 [Dorcoceras hygrometricum]|uniref:Uncharacterized protein n=1 Tax=Dorcoceras hygrometricum TaxID=472368 RepID=A0A2Z7C615_9LAMI|nr:hypothetical protein F511_13882 [Dorcoceras hygrometricum]
MDRIRSNQRSAISIGGIVGARRIVARQRRKRSELDTCSLRAACAVDYNNSLKLTSCAPAHTWAHDQLAHQLSHECASLRLIAFRF